MPKDIDLQDLIKIVSDIQNKNKPRQNNQQIKQRDIKDFEQLKIDIKKVFNDDTYLFDEKLEQLKIFEIKYLNYSEEEPLTKIQNLFYEEAKLLENINISETEYNYAEQVVLTPMDTYASYQKLSVIQLKRYFIWRTKIRNGRFTFPNDKFIYLYVNEIYRQINFKTKEEGFDMLIFLFDNLVRYSIRNYKIFKQIVIEYTMINNLDFNKCQSFSRFLELLYPFTQKRIDELWNNNYLEHLDFILPNYYQNYHRSKFLLNDNLQTFLKTIKKVFQEIDLFLNQHNYSLKDAFFKEIKTSETLSIYPVLCSNNLPKSFQSLVYSAFLRIEYNQTCCYIYTKTFSFQYKEFFEYICLKAENACRRVEHFHLLKEKQFPVLINKTQELEKLLFSKDLERLINITISKETNSYDYNSYDNNNYYEPVKIDMNKLADIRKVSDEVSSKLLTEADIEEPINTIQPVVVDKTNDIWQNLSLSLTLIEKTFLKILLETNNLQQLNTYCLDNNLLLEVMIEAINEKAVASIEDILIDFDGEAISIYDEYLTKIQEGGLLK